MQHTHKFAAVIIVAILISYQNLIFYVSFDFQMIIAIIFAPFVIYFTNKNKKPLRFGVFALVFLVLYPFLKIQSLYFFGFTFFILFLIEANYGKLNNLPIFLLLLLSPLASYVFNVFGFPIRLQLTEMATNMLSTVYQDISFSGNIIYLGKNVYKVAPECMGLNLLTTGLIITLYIISNCEKKSKKTASFFQTSIILFISLLLIVLSNLIRIIGIVILNAAPETLAHEVIGILSLVLYVVVPIYYIVKIFSRHFYKMDITKIPDNQTNKPIFNFIRKYRISTILGIIIIIQLSVFNYFRAEFRNNNFDKSVDNIKLQNFDKEIIQGNIIQFRNKNALIYIKPSAQFYGADHTPMICWKGSGYNFSAEQIISIAGQEVYCSVLKKEASSKLHTAWWYDNGNHQTISQIEWRWNMLLGENPYRLINVTCNTREDLLLQVQILLQTKISSHTSLK